MADQLHDLRRLARQIEATIYVCSGEVPLATVPAKNITIHYKNSGHANSVGTFALPSPTAVAIQELIDAAKPATFGKGDQNVLDTTYRDAFNMDASQFVSSFRLSEYPQMLSEVKTILAPEDSSLLLPRLYKLNVYGPGGFFKVHRDTPRGDANMFGTLVVCLPVEFTGGEFVVKSDEGPATTFDWGAKSTDSIQWCAFYSDTEHEVLPVRSGYRITMTYLLEQVSVGVPPSQPSVRAHAFSTLETKLREALANPTFAPQGVQVGFGLKHAYVADKQGTVPMLKGADRVLKEMLESLGLQYSFLPVYSTGTYDADSFAVAQDNGEHGGDGKVDEDEYEYEEGDRYADVDSEEEEKEPTPAYGWRSDRYKMKEFAVAGVPRGSIRCLTDTWAGDGANNLYVGTWSAYHQRIERAGEKYSCSSLDYKNLQLSKTHRIVWLAPPKSFPLEKNGLAWGNETTFESYYAAASLIAWVPGTKDRAVAQFATP